MFHGRFLIKDGDFMQHRTSMTLPSGLKKPMWQVTKTKTEEPLDSSVSLQK